MQTRHARHGDEADLAALLEEHEAHFGNPVAEGAGVPGAAFLVDPPAGGTVCLVAERNGRLAGFAILNPYFPAPRLTHGLFLKELYVAKDARSPRNAATPGFCGPPVRPTAARSASTTVSACAARKRSTS